MIRLRQCFCRQFDRWKSGPVAWPQGPDHYWSCGTRPRIASWRIGSIGVAGYSLRDLPIPSYLFDCCCNCRRCDSPAKLPDWVVAPEKHGQSGDAHRLNVPKSGPSCSLQLATLLWSCLLYPDTFRKSWLANKVSSLMGWALLLALAAVPMVMRITSWQVKGILHLPSLDHCKGWTMNLWSRDLGKYRAKNGSIQKFTKIWLLLTGTSNTYLKIQCCRSKPLDSQHETFICWDEEGHLIWEPKGTLNTKQNKTSKLCGYDRSLKFKGLGFLKSALKIQSVLFPQMEACNPSKRTNPIKVHSVGFLLRLPVNPHVIVKRLKRGVPLLQAKNLVETCWNKLPNNIFLPMHPCKKSSNASLLGICTAVEVNFGQKSHLGLRRNSTTKASHSVHIHSAPD